MDSSNYRDLSTTRGLVYHYYVSAPKGNKSTLLLLHGWPSSSYDWRHQITFFNNEGYGLIVPDMLGYGGTSKPTDPEAYKSSLLTKDIIEILDAEKVDKAIAIGHDWGSKVTGRLANYYPERFTAYAFLSVGYLPPSPDYTKFEDFLAMTKKLAGYELFGYWSLLSEEGGAKLVEDHLDSFMSLMYADEANVVIEHLAPSGALRAWLEGDKTTKRASYISEEEVKIMTSILREGGMAGPACWYKIMTSRIDFEDNQGIPKENIKIQKPTFLGTCLKDVVVLAPLQKATTSPVATNLTLHEYNAGHWVQVEARDELNRDLLAWIKAL